MPLVYSFCQVSFTKQFEPIMISVVALEQVITSEPYVSRAPCCFVSL